MSNKVKELYELVIDQVINETKTELEENGDDPAIPEMLKKAWQNRLNEMNISREPLFEVRQPGHIPGMSLPSSVANALAERDRTQGRTGYGLTNLSLPSISGDPLALYGIPNGKGLEYTAASVGDSSNPLSIPSGNIEPKTEPESAGSVLRPEVSGNPLGGPGVTLSPELQDQINNAMKSQHPKVPQTDGTQDEELNSDLDDSEDELNSNDEDEEADQTQMMLCLYEKVHKVKTRWKYTLKDGVVNVNGLDYVFARATGESEW